MTDYPYLAPTRSSYDTVASNYAELVPPLFAKDVLGRAMLAAFAEHVRADGNGPVADIGCGPGHVTAHLASLGLTVSGIDLSPRMVEIARASWPDLDFEVGSMTGLDLADGRLGGIVAWWSILHTPPDLLPVVFAEFHRTLAPGGRLLAGFHAGDETVHPTQSYGHPVSYASYRLPPDRVAELLVQAGMEITGQLLMPGDGRPQACLLARKL
ncbi:MAG: class I SAM-dependent methyltransferase [Actinoplanes sp.]